MSLNQCIVDLMRDINEIAINESVPRGLMDANDVHLQAKVKRRLAEQMARHLVDESVFERGEFTKSFDIERDAEIYRIRGIWASRTQLYKLLERAYELGVSGAYMTQPMAPARSISTQISAAQISAASINTSTITSSVKQQIADVLKHQYESAIIDREQYLRQQQTERVDQQYQTTQKYGKEWKI